jgi:hypothetical protein
MTRDASGEPEAEQGPPRARAGKCAMTAPATLLRFRVVNDLSSVRRMKRFLFPTFAALAFVCATSTVVAGQPVTDSKYVQESAAPDPRLIFRWNTSYVFESDFERGHDAKGDAFSTDLELGYRIPLSLGWPDRPDGAWYLRLGARYMRFDFDNEGGLPLPNTLQGIAGVVALEYLVKGRRVILFEALPGVYFEHDISADAFDVPIKAAIPIELSDSFAFIVGVSYVGMRSYPVLPIVGFNWRINDQWTVRAIPPDPRIIYTPRDDLNFWVGGELTGGAFRVDGRDRDHHHDGKLNNAVLTYSDWRVGAGVTCRCESLTFELSGGYSFQRKFDYHRAEEGFETDEGAPYVAMEITAAF